MYRLIRQIFTCTSIAIILAIPAAAQNVDEKAPAQESSPSETDLRVKGMIEKLTSASFLERQQATKDLLNVGPDAVALIETAAGLATGETQVRLRMILPQLQARLFDDQLDAFIAKPSVEMAQALPQWDRFESLCGNDNDAMVVFGQILSAERQLFAARLFSPGDVSPMLEVRTPNRQRMQRSHERTVSGRSGGRNHAAGERIGNSLEAHHLHEHLQCSGRPSVQQTHRKRSS